MERVQSNTQLGRMLDWLREQDATDLHGQADRPYSIRVHGKLSWIPAEVFPAPSDSGLQQMLRESFSAESCHRIEREREVDLSFYHGTQRFRANFSKQKGQQSFSFRTVPQQRMRLADLQLPESLTEIIKEPRGLVLFRSCFDPGD
jgi:Tfp pilus assembly pilus retraction ATPase PilT